jgi:oligosaccharide repeat unit polymerase
MFEFYTATIAAVVVGATIWALRRANDTLHPLVFLMPMSGFLYVYMPINQYLEGGLLKYFSMAEISYVQGFNMVCVSALAAGCWWGSQGLRREPERTDLFSFLAPPEFRHALFQVGVIVGSVALGAYLYQIINVGGFFAAYDSPKGGGWAASGYIRDIDLLAVPAIALIYMSSQGKRLSLGRRLLIGLFSFPLLVHGLLSARRGPTFLAIAALIGGWYLVRNRRPSTSQIAIGGTALGLLLLILVTFRGQIYLGSSFLTGDFPSTTHVVEKSLEQSTRSTFGNEFMYGTYVVLNSRDQAGHYWGKRYLTQLFVRPIPSSIWPNKYSDVGMQAITFNAGQLGTADREQHSQIPPGSAPGYAGSAYVEWSWGGPLFLFALGWFYALAWRRSLVRGGMWTVLYTVLLATSAFFAAQSFLAVLFRLLLMVAPPILLWDLLKPKEKPRHQKPVTASSLRTG